MWFNLYRPSIVGGPAEYLVVTGNSMETTLSEGDLVITRRHSDYHAGEIIAYRVPDGDVRAGLRVIHRVIGGDAATGYITQGDNRATADPWRPQPDDVLGSMALRIPKAGSVVEELRRPPVFALFVGVIVLLAIWSMSRRRRSRSTPETADKVQ